MESIVSVLPCNGTNKLSPGFLPWCVCVCVYPCPCLPTAIDLNMLCVPRCLSRVLKRVIKAATRHAMMGASSVTHWIMSTIMFIVMDTKGPKTELMRKMAMHWEMPRKRTPKALNCWANSTHSVRIKTSTQFHPMQVKANNSITFTRSINQKAKEFCAPALEFAKLKSCATSPSHAPALRISTNGTLASLGFSPIK